MMGRKSAEGMILDGSLREFDPKAFSSFETEPGVYDVVRVVEGVPLFLDEHLARLRKSARLSGFEINTTDGIIAGSIDSLIDRTGRGPYSVKIIFSAPPRKTGVYCAAPVPRKTPSPKEYENGVATRLVHLARMHPQIKEIDHAYSRRVEQEIHDDHVFEILLVDENERITEGGKSNIFLIEGETLVTPPKDEVLPGITRGKIREIAENRGIDFMEKDVPCNTLDHYDAAFLTGTSIFVLPVAGIDNTTYGSAEHPLVKTVTQGYRDLVTRYIHQHKRRF